MLRSISSIVFNKITSEKHNKLVIKSIEITKFRDCIIGCECFNKEIALMLTKRMPVPKIAKLALVNSNLGVSKITILL